MQYYIAKLTGMFGRQDDPDIAFKVLIGPASKITLVRWLRKNGFIDQTGSYWTRNGKCILYCNYPVSQRIVHKIEAEIIYLENPKETKISPL